MKRKDHIIVLVLLIVLLALLPDHHLHSRIGGVGENSMQSSPSSLGMHTNFLMTNSQWKADMELVVPEQISRIMEILQVYRIIKSATSFVIASIIMLIILLYLILLNNAKHFNYTHALSQYCLPLQGIHIGGHSPPLTFSHNYM